MTYRRHCALNRYNMRISSNELVSTLRTLYRHKILSPVRKIILQEKRRGMITQPGYSYKKTRRRHFNNFSPVTERFVSSFCLRNTHTLVCIDLHVQWENENQRGSQSRSKSVECGRSRRPFITPVFDCKIKMDANLENNKRENFIGKINILSRVNFSGFVIRLFSVTKLRPTRNKPSRVSARAHLWTFIATGKSRKYTLNIRKNVTYTQEPSWMVYVYEREALVQIFSGSK